MTTGTEDHREVGGIAGAMSHEPEARHAARVCTVCGGEIGEAPWGVRVTGAGLALACSRACAQSDYFRLPLALLDPDQLRQMEQALKSMRTLSEAVLHEVDDALRLLGLITSRIPTKTENRPEGPEGTTDGNESDVANA